MAIDTVPRFIAGASAIGDAWKEALGEYLRECLALLFPAVHAGIDWSQPHVFLDA